MYAKFPAKAQVKAASDNGRYRVKCLARTYRLPHCLALHSQEISLIAWKESGAAVTLLGFWFICSSPSPQEQAHHGLVIATAPLHRRHKENIPFAVAVSSMCAKMRAERRQPLSFTSSLSGKPQIDSGRQRAPATCPVVSVPTHSSLLNMPVTCAVFSYNSAGLPHRQSKRNIFCYGAV